MKFNNDFTQSYLKSIISYDPETGIFKRLKNEKILGSPTQKGHLLIGINKKQYYSHRLAWLYMTGEWPKYNVDHIDLNPANNKWINLREATHAENLRNRKANKNNTTGYKGVHKNRHGYMVRICIGTYKTLEEAAKIYEEAVKLYHKEFARLS